MDWGLSNSNPTAEKIAVSKLPSITCSANYIMFIIIIIICCNHTICHNVKKVWSNVSEFPAEGNDMRI